MAKHLAEILIEINKKISGMIDSMESEAPSADDTGTWIDDLNNIIRSLDHVVEELERKH